MYFNIPKFRKKFIEQYRHLMKLYVSGRLELYLGRLTEKERFIIKELIGYNDNRPKTNQLIAAMIDICPSRVSQIEGRALRKLCSPL